jgi:hypothetical protein
MSRILITLVCSPIVQTQFMQAADMFERWKVLVEEPIHFQAEVKVGETPSGVIAKVRDAVNAHHEKKYRVIAAFQPGSDEGAWCDQEIVMVSTGHHFCKFADYLKHHLYLGPEPKRYPDQVHHEQPA